jgi:hypothetical protein
MFVEHQQSRPALQGSAMFPKAQDHITPDGVSRGSRFRPINIQLLTELRTVATSSMSIN